MKNKEAYKQAFKHVHYQKEVNLNQKRIPKSLITFVTSFIILLSTFTVAYAFDIGGIQSKIEVWFHGEKRMIQYEEVEVAPTPISRMLALAGIVPLASASKSAR